MIGNTADRRALPLKRPLAPLFQCLHYIARRNTRESNLVLDPWIPLPSVIVHTPCREALDQTLKMFQNMPIMAADRGAERRANHCRIIAVVRLKKQVQS